MPAPYISKCACGEVELRLNGEPANVHDCFCDCCTTHAKYVDDKAATAGTKNISLFEPNTHGASIAGFWVKDIEFVKGQDKMASIIATPKSKASRTYCTCCNTVIIMLGGKGFPLAMRPLNKNTITNEDGSDPGFPLAARLMGHCANREHWDALPDDGVPKMERIDIGYGLKKFIGPILFGWTGLYPKPSPEQKADTTIGLYNELGEDAELIPLETYHSLGFKLDKKVKVEGGAEGEGGGEETKEQA